ncbi:MAG TPA: RHS repeat-associated core domain-containing protein, partial [Armatimonadota bacterium]|nr:RHS repeat-associated core domain-containing protein [Armatimonadota bacterium]
TGSKSPTSYTYYEPSGLIHTMVSPLPGTVGGTQTVTTTYNWDALGNLTSIVAPGNNSATTITTTLGYTTDGGYNQPEALGEPITITDNLGKTSHRRFDSRGNQIAAIDALGNEIDRTVNLADQPVTETYPPTIAGGGRASVTNTYLYTGGPVTQATEFDEGGTQVRQVTGTYGAEGEVLSVSGSTEPVSYTYDANYRLKSLSDGNGHQTAYAYNTAGYLSSIVYPSGDSIQYSQYDKNGQVLVRLDGDGVSTDFVYSDPESRITNIQYPATPVLNVSLGYDQYGGRSGMTDSVGSVSYGYDDLGLLLSKSRTYTGLPQETIGYGYYPDGSRETMTTPAGTLSYGFDADGRPSSLANPYSETSQWSYLDNGWLWMQKLGNGATSYYTYNARGFLTRLQNETSASVILSDFGQTGGMQYDSLGNRTSMPCSVTGSTAGTGTSSYTYGTQDELTQENSSRNGSYSDSFGYDPAFNPTTFKGVTHNFNVDNQDNLISYNGNGNPTSYSGNSTSFDPENRLTAYGSLLTAGYTGDNLRAWKQTASGRTYFLYDGGQPVIELNSSGAVSAVNTFGATGLLSRHTSSGSVFYQFDPQGSVAQRLDANQNVLSTFVFDAYGKELAGGSNGDPWGYGAQAGYFTDGETGLILCTERYYDAGAGRWLNRDPFGYLGGINLYSYVANDPPTRNDPTGFDWLDCWVRCIRQLDPVNAASRALTGKNLMNPTTRAALALVGGTVPKSLAKKLGVRVIRGGKDVTTLPSILSSKLHLGARNPVRSVGRFFSPIFVWYGVTMAGVEAWCTGACAGNPGAY